MKNLILGSVALAAMIAGPAMAADLPVKARPPVAAAYNWTGCYIGDNVGWIGGDDRFNNYPGPTVVAFIGLTPAQVASATHRYTPRESGVTGGAQIGCNWQGPGWPLLFGLEMDFNLSSLKESATAAIPDDGTFAAHTETLTKELKWFSTFRARQGVVWDRWLVYLTGGLAVARISSSHVFQFNGFVVNYSGSDSRARIGFTAGGGLEYAFSNNLSAKIEYLYLDFGTYTFSSPNSALPTVAWATDVRPREHIVRVGLNYRFDWSPVVAKY